MVSIYCTKCKKKTKTKDQRLVRAKNGRYMLKGICAICGSKKTEFVAEHIKPQEGEGPIDFLKRIVRAVKGPRKDKMPPSARNIFEKVKDEKIIHLEVYRTPLSPIIKGVINLVKSRPFDELFHLFMIIETETGKQLLIEKNEVINFRDLRSSDIKENTEGEEVAINKEITIGEMFENAQKAMGEKFYTYSATQNNCQDFILGLLKSSGLGNQQTYNFIKQDIKDIVPEFWENISNKITDLAGAVNIIQEGEGKGEIHAIEADRSYGLKRFKKWLKKHNFETSRIHIKKNSFWANQTPKEQYKSFRKKPIKNNKLNLVIGFLK